MSTKHRPSRDGSDPRRLVEWFERSGVGPLSGIVVADLTRVLAGPYCTMLLGDLGATVIKIESPEGDETRSWRPPVRDDESTYYLSVNRNKHSIVLDLAQEEDAATARAIVERADVVVENFRPGRLARFGLDYESVIGTNPDVVYASITGFGDGGGAALPGYDLLVQAMSGMMDLTGSPDSGPYRSGVAVFDVITGLHTAIGLLAALNHLRATGEGQRVKANLMSSALSGLVNQSGAYVIGGVVPHRMGNAHPSIYPYEPIETADGQLVFAIGNNRQFELLCSTIGAPELPANPCFATNLERSAHRSELRPLLVAALATRSALEWYDLLSVVGVPCAPILDVAAGVGMAERLGLDPIVYSRDSGIPAVRHPLDYSSTAVTYDFAPPVLNGSADRIRGWLAATRTALSEGAL